MFLTVLLIFKCFLFIILALAREKGMYFGSIILLPVPQLMRHMKHWLGLDHAYRTGSQEQAHSSLAMKPSAANPSRLSFRAMSKRQEYRLFLILLHSSTAEARFKRENLNKQVQMSFSRLFSVFQISTLSCIIKEKTFSDETKHIFIHERNRVICEEMHICWVLILIIYLTDSSGQTDSAMTRCSMSLLIIWVNWVSLLPFANYLWIQNERVPFSIFLFFTKVRET